MLTPGGWLATGSMWAGLLNPTYWPSLVARTCTALGLAGLYALLTAARLRDPALKEKVTRYAANWVFLMTAALPVSIAWFLWAAAGAGVQVGRGARAEGRRRWPRQRRRSGCGQRRRATRRPSSPARVVLIGSAATLLLTLVIAQVAAAIVRPAARWPCSSRARSRRWAPASGSAKTCASRT